MHPNKKPYAQLPHALRLVALTVHLAGQVNPRTTVLQISSPGGWECYLSDLFGAGPSMLTAGALDPAKINPIAAKYDIHYEVPPKP